MMEPLLRDEAVMIMDRCEILPFLVTIMGRSPGNLGRDTNPF